MTKCKELYVYYLENLKRIKLSKLTAVTALSSLMFLSSCAKEPTPDPEPPVDELTDKQRELLEQSKMEVLPIEEVFSETPKIVVVNGIEYNFDEYEKELKYPFLYEKLTQEEIEESYLNMRNLVEKARATVAVNSGYTNIEKLFGGTPFYLNDEQLFNADNENDWYNITQEILNYFGYEVVEGSYGRPELIPRFEYDSVSESYFQTPKYFLVEEWDIIQQEIWVRLAKQAYVEFLKFAKEREIEYSKIS